MKSDLVVGKKIKQYLDENGIKQTYLAEKTGIGIQKLNLSLNGNRRIPYEEYELICGSLGVGVDRFLQPKILGEEVSV